METASKTYNGWTNHETWNVALWLNNDEALYNAYRQQSGTFTPETAETFVRGLLPGGTPDFNDVSDYDQVNWAEIAEAMNEE